MKKLLTVLSTVLLVVGLTFAGCNSTTSEPPEGEEKLPPEEPATPPELGEWTAQTGSSQFTFTFTVVHDPTGIAKISTIWTEFECGGVTMGGSVSVSSPPFLCAITDGQFTCEEGIPIQVGLGSSIDWDLVIQGEFDEAGTSASGTWEIGSQGTTCAEGTWEASAPET